MPQKRLALIEEEGKKVEIFNDLKGFSGKGIALSEVYDAFHTRNEKLIKRVLDAKVLQDSGFIRMLKTSVSFSDEINKKFPEYIISVIIFGSWSRGEASPASDYDLAVIVDDTDLKEMTRVEAKQRLFSIVNLTARKMSEKFTIQAYLLTEFWDYLRKANPVIFTLLRDGVPIYDRGLFIPWKLLLKMGKITPTPEAIETFISSARLLGKQIESKLEEIVVENIYYLMLNPAQALLMLSGVSPATYSETPVLLRKHFGAKKIMPMKYIKWLEEIVELRKKVEHKKEEITGKALDSHWKRAEEYLAFMEELFQRMKEEKSKKSLMEIDRAFSKTVKETLRSMGQSTGDEVYTAFRKYLVNKGLVPSNYLEFANYLYSLKKASKTGRAITETELEKARGDAADLFNVLNNIVETRKVKPGKPVRFVFRGGEGELWLLGRKAFIIKDIKHPEEPITMASLAKDGSFVKILKADVGKLNSERKKWKGETVLMEKTLEDLAGLLGKETRIIF
jgi:uncharacterized protein (UPF0332 family)/predicted nucleotidyltransferase